MIRLYHDVAFRSSFQKDDITRGYLISYKI